MVTEREYQAGRHFRGAKRHTNLPKSTLLGTILILGILGLGLFQKNGVKCCLGNILLLLRPWIFI